MRWLTRLFQRRYRLPKPPPRKCGTVCVYCGRRRPLVHQAPYLMMRGLPAGICEDCTDKCSIE